MQQGRRARLDDCCRAAGAPCGGAGRRAAHAAQTQALSRPSHRGLISGAPSRHPDRGFASVAAALTSPAPTRALHARNQERCLPPLAAPPLAAVPDRRERASPELRARAHAPRPAASCSSAAMKGQRSIASFFGRKPKANAAPPAEAAGSGGQRAEQQQGPPAKRAKLAPQEEAGAGDTAHPELRDQAGAPRAAPSAIPSRVPARQLKAQRKLVESERQEQQSAAAAAGRADKPKYTPLEQQVVALKQQHPGVLLVVEVSCWGCVRRPLAAVPWRWRPRRQGCQRRAAQQHRSPAPRPEPPPGEACKLALTDAGVDAGGLQVPLLWRRCRGGLKGGRGGSCECVHSALPAARGFSRRAAVLGATPSWRRHERRPAAQQLVGFQQLGAGAPCVVLVAHKPLGYEFDARVPRHHAAGSRDLLRRRQEGLQPCCVPGSLGPAGRARCC
jgi:hypothetical protein